MGLALFYDDVVRPDGRVADRLGHGLWRAYTEPASSGHDLILDQPVTWTLGFQVSDEGGAWCSEWEGPAAAPRGPIRGPVAGRRS